MLLYQIDIKSRRDSDEIKENDPPVRRTKEESDTRTQNKVKPDTILKTFWRNNERFADLFNTVLFHGNQILKPDELQETDTDLSSVLKINGHVETIQKIFDVVKKTANGVEFIIWGLENQEKIHYAMPLRHMLNDSLVYLKECNEISARHRKEKDVKTSGEFLSGLKKEDRLHPIISLCVYYGEDEWDGPVCLTDMLEISEELKPMISDYKLNLVQVKKCGELKFHNNDINTVFELVRFIYNQDYDKINTIYKDSRIDTELALVIGAVTNSQRIIDQAMSLELEGEKMNMCKALEALEQRGVETGKKELLKQQIEKKIAKGKTLVVIADELEEEIETIQSIINELEMGSEEK